MDPDYLSNPSEELLDIVRMMEEIFFSPDTTLDDRCMAASTITAALSPWVPRSRCPVTTTTAEPTPVKGNRKWQWMEGYELTSPDAAPWETKKVRGFLRLEYDGEDWVEVVPREFTPVTPAVEAPR